MKYLILFLFLISCKPEEIKKNDIWESHTMDVKKQPVVKILEFKEELIWYYKYSDKILVMEDWEYKIENDILWLLNNNYDKAGEFKGDKLIFENDIYIRK